MIRRNVDEEAIKREFARRLQAALFDKGWNQSELARQASMHLPKPAKGQKRGQSGIGRSSISHYLRGQMLPLPVYLEAMAKALDLRPEQLMPPAGMTVAPAGPMEVRREEGDRGYIRLNRTMSWKAVRKIMDIVEDEDKKGA